MTQQTVTINDNENAKTSESQKQRILEFLLTGCSITQLQALEWFGCMRLPSRINEIRNDGFHVNSETIVIESPEVRRG